MIKDLMGKLHIQDSINDKNPQKKEEGQNMAEQPQQQAPQSAPKPPVPPAPSAGQSAGQSQSSGPEIKVQKEGESMENDGIIIDLGEGISLNVPIKKRMALHEFLRVAEKVKALEMLAEEGQVGRKY